MTTSLPMLDQLRVPSQNPELLKGVEGLKSPAAVIKRIIKNFDDQRVDCMEAVWNALLISKRSLRHGSLMVEHETSSREEVRNFFSGDKENRPHHFWYYNGNRYFILVENNLCVGVTCSGKEEARDVASRLKESGVRAKLAGDKVTLYQYVGKVDLENVDFSSPVFEMTKLSFKELGIGVVEVLQTYFNVIERVKFTRESPIIDLVE